MQTQPTSLFGAGISIGATSIILVNFLDILGNPITMSQFGAKGWATIDPGNGSQEEQISFTGLTQNGDSTCTVTGVSSALFIYPYTETSGCAKTHIGGAVFVISNTAGFYNQFAAVANDETITGLYTFTTQPIVPTPTLSTSPTTKAYVDTQVAAGAPNASTTVKGIVQEATIAQINAGTGSGSTGAELFVQPASLLSSNYGNFLPTTGQKDALAGTSTPSAGNKYVNQSEAQLISNLSTDPLLGGATPSATSYPSQGADKQYTDLQLVSSTIFEVIGRFSVTNVSGGIASINGGLQLDTSNTTTSSTKADWAGMGVGSSDSTINGNPIMVIGFNMSLIGTSGSVYMGLGVPTVAGTGITYTIRHIGFKITMTAGPTATLFATQADGTTENASSALTTLTTTDDVEVAFRVNGTSSVDYFWRKNGGTWSAATNLTTNFPSTAISSNIRFAATNSSTTQENTITFYSATYKR